MRPLNIIPFALYLTFLSAPGFSAIELSQITRTDHFIIRHGPKLRANAEVIGQACEAWLTDLNNRLGLPQRPTDSIPISLYRNQREFSDATGYDRPGQVLGRASSSGAIELDASGIFAPAGQVAGHEIVHVLIFRILNGRSDILPLWVNEGAAKYLTGEWDMVDRTILANAITQDKLLPISAISHSFPSGSENEALAYAESTSAVRFLDRTYGKEALPKLIDQTADTGSFALALKSVTGLTPDQFENRWRRSIEGDAGVSQMVRMGRLLAAIALPVLTVAAYLGIRRKKRRIIEQYEQEEWEAANRRDWGLD